MLFVPNFHCIKYFYGRNTEIEESLSKCGLHAYLREITKYWVSLYSVNRQKS